MMCAQGLFRNSTTKCAHVTRRIPDAYSLQTLTQSMKNQLRGSIGYCLCDPQPAPSLEYTYSDADSSEKSPYYGRGMYEKYLYFAAILVVVYADMCEDNCTLNVTFSFVHIMLTCSGTSKMHLDTFVRLRHRQR